ncbi:MAG: hypothetical protein KGL94_11850, partial [Acidobacteriota bacterium]|nr:hypothetical protein [Acidobacteriota bacterium]
MSGNQTRRLLSLVALGMLTAALITVALGRRSHTAARVTYSDLIARAQQRPSSIFAVVFKPGSRSIDATLSNGTVVTVHYPSDQSQAQFQELLQRKHVQFDSQGTGTSAWRSVLGYVLPLALLVAVWIFLMRRMGAGAGGGNRLMSFGKSRAKRMAPDSPKIGFKDVAGV